MLKHNLVFTSGRCALHLHNPVSHRAAVQGPQALMRIQNLEISDGTVGNPAGCNVSVGGLWASWEFPHQICILFKDQREFRSNKIGGMQQLGAG